MIKLDLPALSGLLLMAGVWGLMPTPAVWTEADTHEAPITVEAGVEPDQVTVGDLATYSIRVKHPPGWRITPPSSDQWPGFDLIDQGVSAARQVDGSVEQEFWFRLRADLVGYHTLAGLPIHVQTPEASPADSGESREVRAPDVKIQIRSVLYTEGEPEDLHDIKPIIGAAYWWERYLTPVLGLIFLSLVAGYLVERWLEKHRIHPAAQPAPLSLFPHELALRELQHLYDKGYIEQGRLRELYFELSEIFRRYLGTRYRIPALDWSTEEIADALNRHPEADAESRGQGGHILNATDLVKFAKLPVQADTAVEHMKMVRDFIRMTTRTKSETVIETSAPTTPES